MYQNNLVYVSVAGEEIMGERMVNVLTFTKMSRTLELQGNAQKDLCLLDL